MASLLRQIVAGPRAKHQETGLDLCYLTDNIIITSGPSQTYPQRAYRNPLDRLVAFLDAKHGDNWAIWEFRAEGTGYPDEAVYGRIRHYPWPDHHPPPFRLMPMIVASMRNWLNGDDDDPAGTSTTADTPDNQAQKKEGRVVVVHCKAGKGRSGTSACSYLISQCGWTPEAALARFTEKRMRPQFGAGISIPSQLRTISYVDRWTKGGKKYVDRAVEITEVHVWGLRHGVKLTVEGFADEGKKIKVLHTFNKKERYIVAGDAPGGGGVMDFLGDALSPAGEDEADEGADYNEIVGGQKNNDKDPNADTTDTSRTSTPSQSQSNKGSRSSLFLGHNSNVKNLVTNPKSKTINPADFTKASSGAATPTSTTSAQTLPNLSSTDSNEPGGMAVIFKPATPVRIANSDINVSLERRSRTPAYLGMTMVTAVAHVWFNAFFEGNGPEQDGNADESGVFDIDWEKMDGIKGSSRKGTKAADRISVVWRCVQDQAAAPGVVITEPGEGSPVPQMRPADWKGGDEEDPDKSRKLGLRATEPASENASKASSIKSAVASTVASSTREGTDGKESDDESLKGVKSHFAPGDDDTHSVDERGRSAAHDAHAADESATRNLSEHDKKVEATKGHTENPEEASGAAKAHEALSQATEPSGLQGDDEHAGGETHIAGESSLHQGDGTGAVAPPTGDTEHLGYVKKGKKLLPMHPAPHGSATSAEGTGEGEAHGSGNN